MINMQGMAFADFLVISLLAGNLALFFIAPFSSTLFSSFSLLAIAVLTVFEFRGIAREEKPSFTNFWFLLFIGGLFWVAADTMRLLGVKAAVAVPLYLMVYVFAVAAFLIYIRGLSAKKRFLQAFAPGVVSGVFSVFLFGIVIYPVAVSGSLGLLEKAIGIGFPLVNIVMVFLSLFVFQGHLRLKRLREARPYLLASEAFLILASAELLYMGAMFGRLAMGIIPLIDLAFLFGYFILFSAAHERRKMHAVSGKK